MTRALAGVALFELRYHLRRISTWIYFGIFFAIAVLLMAAIGGAFESVNMAVAGSGGNVFVNSPRSLLALVMTISVFGFIVTAALLGNAVFRDFDTLSFPLFFTSGISRFAYLGGRFVGALFANAIIFLAIPLGLIVGSLLPFLDAERVGPIRLDAYFHPYIIGVLPNLLLTGAVFFGLAALTRQMLANHVGGVILLVGYLIASNATDFEDAAVAALADPFGLAAFGYVTRYWTPAEQNSLLVPMQGEVLWNRVIWIAVGVAVLAFTFWRFRFAQPGTTAKSGREGGDGQDAAEAPRGLALPSVHLHFDAASHFRQYRATFESALRGIVLNRYFVAILGAALVFLVFAAGQVGKLYGTTTWPVTYLVLELLGGMFTVFVLIVITFYGGELIWRERDQRMDQVVDASPVPNWVQYAAKFTALVAIVVMLQAVLLLAGVATQAAKGYFNFELGLYVQTLFGYQLLDYLLLCVLVTLIHVVVDHKYLGHAIVVLYFGLTLVASQFGFEHNLYLFDSDSGLVYSDMNGYGPFAAPFLWFKAYWAGWALLFAIASNLLWVRGRETGPKWRLQLARLRATRPVVTGTILAALLTAGLGGFMFYNTNVLNEYTTSLDRERNAAEYERLYKRFEGAPQPRIASVSVDVDLYPETRDVVTSGSYVLVNRSGAPIDSVHVRIPSAVDVRRMEFGRPAEEVLEDEDRGYRIYRLGSELAPGDTLGFEFEIAYVTRGMENEISNLRMVENGTFLTSEMMPHFGYSENGELQDDEIRRKHGLDPRERMPEADDMSARMNNALSGDADWVDFEATVSTAPDQIAIAPGDLEREWQADGRRYFAYRMRSPILDFYSILSARYAVKRDSWRDVGIEIYYDPAHGFNVDRMVDAVKKSLEYYTREFGPYQHDQLRIVEFPRYETFAQSFPGTIPFSEAIGFIARVEDPREDIDYPFYVTAHEVAHQWWGHQTVGGNVRGSSFLVETLAQYSALMVMEDEYGQEQMEKFLKYELDNYLTGRAFERKRELPLLEVENQPYIHYNKGSVVMYALRDYIGEETLNGVLREFLEDTRFEQPPYTSSLELYERLKAATPDSLQYVLRDMFEEITLYENRATGASAVRMPDGRYRVSLQVEAQKARADSLGNEVEVPMNDLVDVGVFGPATDGAEHGPLLFLEKRRITDGPQTIDMMVDGEPARAGIDPLHKLIDRTSDDNVVAVAQDGG